ncbi:MAG TPA: FecR family protein [Sunxiuqinia sp.]|nr:FecR family protein [Sunxiuqinia sp.]
MTPKNCPSFILMILPEKKDSMEQLLDSYQVPVGKDMSVTYNEIIVKIEGGNSSRRLGKVRHLNSFYRTAISIAASLVLIFLLHFFFAVDTIESGGISVNTLRLPDNSRVVLSKNSSASYPKYWWKREVNLNGEAYFEVEKGDQFIVKTNEGSVSVLGTRFQVSEIKNGLIVSCYEGKVRFTDHDQTRVVEAGHSMTYENRGIVETRSIQNEYPPSAFFNRSFSNEDLSTVLKDLENFFDVRIRFTSIGHKHFTGKLETGKAETAIRIICRSLNLDYSFSSKEEIIIHEKEKSYES